MAHHIMDKVFTQEDLAEDLVKAIIQEGLDEVDLDEEGLDEEDSDEEDLEDLVVHSVVDLSVKIEIPPVHSLSFIVKLNAILLISSIFRLFTG